jgi:alkylation response protein AidB-like acyl-CoA dehydrogenase
MDPPERRAVEAALRRFAARVDQTLFAGAGADGDLARLPLLLAEARDMGLVADPDPASSGYELGVWGQACHEEGLARSLLTLSLLGEACAGVACAIHAQGLACLTLNGQTYSSPANWLAAAFSPNYGVPLSARLESQGSGLRLMNVGNAVELSGTSHFLLAPDRPDTLVCFALQPAVGQLKPEWTVVLVKSSATGVELTEVTHRTGLRAAKQYHLSCNHVVVSPDQVVRTGEAAHHSLQQVVACDWLGQAAIALGAARRALRGSRAYAAQRYQGGQLIQEHASIQLLQGTAEYDTALMEAILYQHADEPLASLDPIVLLRWAINARLAVVEHAHRAVTNCLQTLGGYGYMEDYHLEKRLRDVSVLKGLHGAPDQLRLFLNELARTE